MHCPVCGEEVVQGHIQRLPGGNSYWVHEECDLGDLSEEEREELK
jgi:hypothetical protein